MPNIRLVIGSETHSFEAAPSQSLLDAAVESGVPVSFSCRRGDCRQCLGTLQAGGVTPVTDTQPCLEEGEVFLCNAVALNDVTIEMPHFPELDGVSVIRSPSKVHELTRLSEDVVEVVLRLPPAANFRFLPGQFVRLTNKEGVTRSYSLAAGPDVSKQLRIHVRRVEGGAFSDYLFARAKAGDLLQLYGPQGGFFLREADAVQRTIFLSTGTGIAPNLAILTSLTPAQRERLGEIDLYWGNRHHHDEYLRERLLALSAEQGFRYWPLHSRSGEDLRHVQDLMALHHQDLSDAMVFACGSNVMIEAARERCIMLGLPKNRFYSDPFTSS